MFKPRIVIKTKKILNNSNIEFAKKMKESDSEGAIDKTDNEKNENIEKPKNKKNKKTENMLNEEQISAAEAQANSLNNNVKVVKKDRGLIERTESSKIILTEDNRQVLND